MGSDPSRQGFTTPSSLSDSISQSSSYSRRPSATTIPISQLSSRRTSLNSPSTVPLLSSNHRASSGRATGIRDNRGIHSKWTTDPREWRRWTWLKIVIWSTPFFLLLLVVLHKPARLGPTRETVSKLRKQIDLVLHSSSSYTCPSPLTGRPTTSFDDPKTLTPFESIRSNHTGFSLAISYSTTVCNSFRIKISRNNPAICLRNLNTPSRLNEDAETTEWIKNSLGPDTFQLRVDGAERYVVDVPSKYDPERCEYYFDFPLSNSGPIWLNGLHLYENYDAYNSQPRHEIDRLLSPLFSTPLRLSLCPPSCTPFVPPLLAQPPSTFSARFDSAPRARVVPSCSSLSPISGSYVPSAYPSLLYPPFQLPQTPTRPSAGFHTFIPSSCTYSHDGLRFKSHETCFHLDRANAKAKGNNRILFIGDSHTRGLYDVVLKRLNGSDEMALTSFKVANKMETIRDGLYLEFLWDPFLEATFNCDYMSRFTHVVVSTGSHQACYRCPPTAQYVSHMSTIFETWPRLHSTCSTTTAISSGRTEGGGGRGKFVFVTNPAWFPQAIEKFDCRTSQRLSRWNELTTRNALERGWRVVDAEAFTKSIAVDTRLIDGVHYIKTDAIDPMVDDLIQKLEIC